MFRLKNEDLRGRVQIQRILFDEAGWFFCCSLRRGGDGWLALAKREPFVNCHPIHEPGEVWFEYGDTALGAAKKLAAEVLPGHSFSTH